MNENQNENFKLVDITKLNLNPELNHTVLKNEGIDIIKFWAVKILPMLQNKRLKVLVENKNTQIIEHKFQAGFTYNPENDRVLIDIYYSTETPQETNDFGLNLMKKEFGIRQISKDFTIENLYEDKIIHLTPLVSNV